MAKVETSVTELKLNKLTKTQYDSIEEPSNTELYFVTDEPIDYNDLANKPALKPVAITGSYDSLTEKPIVNGIEIDSTNKTNYGISTTDAGTEEKVVSIPSITVLEPGQVIVVQPTITSTVANSTIKLNNFPAYPMRYNKKAIVAGGATSTYGCVINGGSGYSSAVWNANFPSTWLFDGSYWVFLSHGFDINSAYTINYSVDNGPYIAGNGTYAVSRFSLLMQKPDMTWEKITNTNINYTTAQTKTVNTSGFLLNQIRYFGSTSNYANGAKIASNVCYEKYSSLDFRYSSNCGTPTWTNGDYIYLVGSINSSDGLFYLDTTQWWTNTLPNTADGKLYIRIGLVITANSYNISFFEDRPVFYHDGTKLCEYKVADNKQDKLISGTNLKTINNISLLGSGNITTNDLLPSQTGNTGKFLTTDGTDIGWEEVDAFPDQTGNNGKFLMTDGSVVSWEQLSTVATSGSYTDLSDQPTINDLTTTAQQNALNSGITSSLTTQITTSQNDISTIQGKIPSAATSSNQLADKAFVNSTVTTLLARYITSSVSGDSFATKAALDTGPYYLDGTAITTANLNNNDYAMVMEDETHDNKPARYIWSGTQWSFQYVLNNTTFTQAQVDAMNSTITSSLVNDYSTHIADTDIHVTTIDKSNWNSKQAAITGAASTITSNNLTSSRVLISNNSGKVAISDTTSTELSYVHGVTSAIQTQLDNKVAKTNENYKIYGTDGSGNQITYTASSSFDGGTVAVRASGGQLRVTTTPSGNNDATSKKYVDDNLALKASISSLSTVATSGNYNDLSNKLIDGIGININADNSVNIIQLDKTYTEIGSLTQSSEGVYSGFGPNAYVRLALGFTDDFTNGSGIFRVKTGNNLTGIQPILCDTATTQYIIGLVDGIPTFYNIENITQLDNTPLSTNTWYWFAITADENGDIYYSCIEDNDYTIETLPPFSQWTVYVFMLHNDFLNVLANTSLQVGKDFWNHVWNGEIDLKDSIAIVDNIPVWGYLDLGTVPAKATIDKYGLVRPDDTTITVNDGIISYKNTNGYITANSPALTGAPTAPTPTTGDSSTKIATTEFVSTAVNTLNTNVVHKTGEETISGAKTFTSQNTKLAAGTTFTKQSSQLNLEGGELHFEKGNNDPTITNYVVEDLYNGTIRFFATCNLSGGETETRIPFVADFTNNRINTPSIYLNNVPQNDVGTSSRFVPTIGWVNNPTNGVNNIVHKSGEEVIAGTKRFTDVVSLKNISYSLFDNTTSSKYLYYNDKDGHATGWIESRINNASVTGESRLRLFAQTYTDNTFITNITACIDVVANPDGTIYATAPTPSTSDNSNKIATTQWVRSNTNNQVDNTTISINGNNKLQAIGTKNKNTSSGATSTIYDWIGTLAEYKTQNVAITHPEWLCYITDDLEGGDSVYTRIEQDVLLASKANIDLSNVLSNIDYVIESQLPTAQNNYTWYRKYKSGWVEQGGYGVASSGITYVTLPVQMANIAYTATGAIAYSGASEGTIGFQFIKATNRLGIGARYNGIFNNGLAVDWQVSGIAA